ncbi:MAG: type II toxin-antitoxin system RelE/ParE family toxin [Cyanobacteria bacterium J06631_2]
MILSSKNQGSKDIFDGKDTKSARQICPQSIWKVARKKLDQLDFAASLNDLRSPPKNKLEALEGDRRGQYSIRINNQYRICFIWSDDGVEEIKVVDYH